MPKLFSAKECRIPRIISIIFAIQFCSFGSMVFACLNPVGTSLVSEPIWVDNPNVSAFFKDFTTHADKAYWSRTLAELKRRPKNMSDLEIRNNTAVALLHLGQLKEAIQILEKIERDKPGLYFTAANLGTAYELNGENQKALDWIKEGINRNADAHNATEWLHVKILEAKLAIEKHPDWLKTNSVLEVDFSLGMTQATDHHGKKKSLQKVESALVYQLHERLEFIKPPEAVVADLLFDLSRVFSSTRSPEHAEAIRNLAQSYGVDHRPISMHEKPEVEKIEHTGLDSKYFAYAGLVTSSLIIAFVALYMFKRKRRSTFQ